MVRRGAWPRAFECRNRAMLGAVPMGLCLLWPGLAAAGAWNPPRGEGQVIVKYEYASADLHHEADGTAGVMPYPLREHIAALWGEYGLTDDLTLVLKTEWQEVEDAGMRFSGRGPVEIGARWQAWRGPYSALAVQVSHIDGGDGRNAAWALPGQGEHETEVRVLAGHSYGFWRPTFIEGQLARRWRDGLEDETRLELTAGIRMADNWTAMLQTYSGWVDSGGGAEGPRWTKAEISMLRRFDEWALQAGYRVTLEGRQVPAAQGPVVALWRRF